MKNPRRASLLLLSLTATLGFVASASAQQHIMQNLAEAKWGPAPPMLPPGAQIEVLVGNPMGNSSWVLRLKCPAGYKIPAHSHPTDESGAVLSGKFYLGMGDKLTEKGSKALGVGGFAMLPANMNHYAYTKRETVILLFGQGPLEFKYVDPADDPRNKK